VREVHPLKNLTLLPCTPAFVLGVVNLRGRIVAVLDLKRFFGLPEAGITDLHRVILVGGNDLEFGVLADIGVGMMTIAVDSILAPMPTLTGVGANYIKGVTAERLVVLDVGRILADPGIVVHEEVET
jgi:purine-binding chemotaxis protein CheW